MLATISRFVFAAALSSSLSIAAQALPVNGTGNVTPDIIFGSGNANGSFTGVTNGGLELGLRAKLRYNGAGNPENTFNYDGVDTYTFNPGQSLIPPGRSVFNFEWSINTNQDGTGSNALNDFSFFIDVDNDSSAVTNFVTYNPLSGLNTGAYLGTNANGNGGTPFTPSGALGAVDLSTFNVAQNSVNMLFVLIPATGVGTWDIRLRALDANNKLAGSTQITVNAVPIPAALPLLASALGLMGFFGWRRKRQAAA